MKAWVGRWINARAETALLLRLAYYDLPTFRMSVFLLSSVLLIVMANAMITFADLLGGVQTPEFLFRFIDITRDQSLASYLMHGFAFLCSVMFLMAFLTYRRRLLLLIALVYGFVWLDDAAQFHERMGAVLARRMDLPQIMGLRSADLGEILAWGIVGALLLPVTIWVARKLDRGDRGIALLLAAAFAVLAICGLGLDALDRIAPPDYEQIVALAEDGGEMLAVTFAAVLGLVLNRIGDSYFQQCSVEVPFP